MWTIDLYVDHRGRSPLGDFIAELPKRDQVKVRYAFQLLRLYGPNLGMPHVKHIDGKLWELRPGGVRLFYFMYLEQQFVILHGYRKQSNKAPDWEIEIAKRRMEELMEES